VRLTHVRNLKVTVHMAHLDELHQALAVDMNELAYLTFAAVEVPGDTSERLICLQHQFFDRMQMPGYCAQHQQTDDAEEDLEILRARFKHGRAGSGFVLQPAPALGPPSWSPHRHDQSGHHDEREKPQHHPMVDNQSVILRLTSGHVTMLATIIEPPLSLTALEVP